MVFNATAKTEEKIPRENQSFDINVRAYSHFFLSLVGDLYCDVQGFLGLFLHFMTVTQAAQMKKK